MTALQQALGRLFESIDNLEGAAEGQRGMLQEIKQRDLFNGSGMIDPTLLARKLDATIGKVELILREG